uniref:Uncharacterized protein n=1 Tax=Arundo donax TaxID=35708 RepID=A0A0A9HMC6_ARUDO
MCSTYYMVIKLTMSLFYLFSTLFFFSFFLSYCSFSQGKKNIFSISFLYKYCPHYFPKPSKTEYKATSQELEVLPHTRGLPCLP